MDTEQKTKKTVEGLAPAIAELENGVTYEATLLVNGQPVVAATAGQSNG